MQEAILKYSGVQQETTVRASFEGAAKASKGRNLGHKNNKVHSLWNLSFLLLLVFSKGPSAIKFCSLTQLFFPIVDSGHWISFTVDFEHKVFVFLDSYYDKDSPFHLRVKDRLVSLVFHSSFFRSFYASVV